MKALSIRQPWVELILQGIKTHEIRSWSTDYRGPLTIHAARNIDGAAMKHYPSVSKAPRGGLLGEVELVDVERLTAARWRQLRAFHCVPDAWDPTRHTYAFVLAAARRFDLVPYAGTLHIFEIDREVVP